MIQSQELDLFKGTFAFYTLAASTEMHSGLKWITWCILSFLWDVPFLLDFYSVILFRLLRYIKSKKGAGNQLNSLADSTVIVWFVGHKAMRSTD